MHVLFYKLHRAIPPYQQEPPGTGLGAPAITVTRLRTSVEGASARGGAFPEQEDFWVRLKPATMHKEMSGFAVIKSSSCFWSGLEHIEATLSQTSTHKNVTVLPAKVWVVLRHSVN